LIGSSNPFTPAGYVGYLTRGAIFGQARFHGVQRGPTSPGRTWLLAVANVSITPYTYNEDFVGNDAVLSRDNLTIAFRVHTDHSRTAERDVHPARSDRGAESDGRLAESHGRLHSGRPDGRAADRDVSGDRSAGGEVSVQWRG
jgi:hypothetical protein